MTRSGGELSPQARAFLKALASPTRQAILFEFEGGIELTVTQVAQRLGLAQSATSTHLSVLREAGVLTSRREWKAVYYTPEPTGLLRSLDDLRSYLLTCCPPSCTDDPASGDSSRLPARSAGLRGGEGIFPPLTVTSRAAGATSGLVNRVAALIHKCRT